MNYKKHYDILIQRSQSRILEGYVEKHHIVPRCMGGTDDFDNIAILTPEEHYLAHLLLVKMYPNEFKLIFAAHMMCSASNGLQRSNKLYGWLRRKHALALSKNPRKPRKKETKPRKKRLLSEEHRKKISQARKGHKHNPETIAKIKQSNILAKSSKN